ncbi:hypothetical protein RCS94_05925 [Orbaceae bacterium ac157xtp]
MIAPLSYGALSAVSANTIKGNAPTVQNSRLGFKVNGESFSVALGNIDPSVAKEFDAGLSFSHFTIINLTDADYYDADGDVAHPTTSLTTGTKSVKWYDGNGTEITDTNKLLGCGTNYSLPLTLKIKIQDVQVHSKYGNPRDSVPTALEQSYKIMPTQGICFAKPGALVVFSSSPIRHPTKGGGHTADFDPANGFKANPTVSSVKFPTTAFPGARFQLKMTGSQTDWNYSVITNPNNAVTVDPINGWVTINNKPTGAIKVRATSKSSSSTYFDYTFEPTKLWAVPKVGTANYANSITKCGVESKVLSREQWTNSPKSLVTPSDWIVGNSYTTRAIGKIQVIDAQGNMTTFNESLTGEWGYLGNNNYPDSSWVHHWHWTREAYSSNEQFAVLSGGGDINFVSSIHVTSYYIACLE